MKQLRTFLTVLAALVTVGGSVAVAQQTPDTTRIPLYRYTNAPAFYYSGRNFVRSSVVRTGPDSAPASTANADSIFLQASALSGYTLRYNIFGSASASNAKSVVVTFTAAGATTTIDSLQMKTGGGRWFTTCYVTVRNATPTTDSTQVVWCSHTGSADSSTTSSAAPLTTTVKMIPSATSNKIAVHNATGTAKGDVVVHQIIMETLPAARVNGPVGP